jgi:hypothetical protein
MSLVRRFELPSRVQVFSPCPCRPPIRDDSATVETSRLFRFSTPPQVRFGTQAST